MRILWLHTPSQTTVLFPLTLGDHQEGTVEENNERLSELFRKQVWKQQAWCHASSLQI